MLLENVQNNLFIRAQKFYDAITFETEKYTEMKDNIINESKVALVYWCQSEKCADEILRIEGVEIVGILPGDESTGDCIICGKPSGKKTYVAKTY